MGIEYVKKLSTPEEIKEKYPMNDEMKKIKQQRDEQIKQILSGELDKFLLIIGPCSADCEESVLDYVKRLKNVQEKVKDKIFIIPRVYTNKPRTTGKGYKGMLHQPNVLGKEDMKNGLEAIRKLHIDVVKETGLTSADEMLYPENYEYLSDVLSYVAIGARSVEDQHHRMTASGFDIPAGMKNPTSGDISVMLNSIMAAQCSHKFIYRGWEVNTTGNDYAHAVLRGYVNKHGQSLPNYHYEDLIFLQKEYMEKGLKNPSVIIDTNHSNSGKKHDEQIRIAKEIVASRNKSQDINKMVKGLMIESYIEDGACNVEERIYGKSITDPCLGWEKTEKLILDLAEML
ncbi:MAG: 3-deoxy-7-phosphoheptulonate synthase [Clostridia bacterium]|nr:3-deoxy-7-phosphoheptulonate synthase [Clostridia bacterium]